MRRLPTSALQQGHRGETESKPSMVLPSDEKMQGSGFGSEVDVKQMQRPATGHCSVGRLALDICEGELRQRNRCKTNVMTGHGPGLWVDVCGLSISRTFNDLPQIFARKENDTCESIQSVSIENGSWLPTANVNGLG